MLGIPQVGADYKNKKEIESKLHLAVLGEIPVADKLLSSDKGFKKLLFKRNREMDFDESKGNVQEHYQVQKEGGK